MEPSCATSFERGRKQPVSKLSGRGGNDAKPLRSIRTESRPIGSKRRYRKISTTTKLRDFYKHLLLAQQCGPLAVIGDRHRWSVVQKINQQIFCAACLARHHTIPKMTIKEAAPD